MIRFPQLEAAGVAVAAMTERSDGDCRQPGEATPRAMCCARLAISPDASACGQQVHGTAIAVVGERERGRGAFSWDSALPNADGLITATPGIALTVFVADCVPVFLYAPVAGAAGLIHAGRQGTFKNIAGRAVTMLEACFSASPMEILAVIGPSAGPMSYEVSESLACEWKDAGLPCNGRNLDLWEANRSQLGEAGVPLSQIFVSGMCTITNGRFFSFRRGDTVARNMAVLML